MKNSWIWTLAFIFLLLLPLARTVSDSEYAMEWIFEPKVNGYVHTKIKFTLPWDCSDWVYSCHGAPLENVKAWEVETGRSVRMEHVHLKGDLQRYYFIFEEKKQEGFQWWFEYDQKDTVEETLDEVYYYYYARGRDDKARFKATVIFPTGHEFLYSDFQEPNEVSSSLGRVSIVFSEDTPTDATFFISVTFSQKGVQFLKEAQNKYNLGQYSEAKKACQGAISFYSQFETLYNRNRGELLAELRDSVAKCDAFLEEERIARNRQMAEEKFEEAVAAFDSGDYAAAKTLFEQAQNMYASVGNMERKGECQGYIAQCIQFLEQEQKRTEAEGLLNDGIALFEEKQYESAKIKLEEALKLFTELEDEEKVQECNQWISSCNEALMMPNTMYVLSGVLIVVALSLLGIGVYKKRGRKKPLEEKA